MGLKSMAAGFAAGYVLGAKAGRGRYDQISTASSKVWHSRPVQAGVTKAQQAAGDAFQGAKSKVSDILPFGTKAEVDAVEADVVEF